MTESRPGNWFQRMPSRCKHPPREWYSVSMIVRDWRDADVGDTQLLYAREQDFWVRELTWDASNSWREIEQARTTWGLPGRMAIDHKRTVRGWSYYMPDGETLHIGGIAADTKEATAALVDACLEMAATPPRPRSGGRRGGEGWRTRD